MECSVCGSSEFVDSRKGTKNVICKNCESHERARVLVLFLKKYDLPKPGMKVLHFAPERGVAEYIHNIIGKDNYETYDISPKNYHFDFHRCRKLDICNQLDLLENRKYDLIIHNHVLEHLPCNYTMVLLQLHSLLKPNGHHAFSIPILKDINYSEDLSDLDVSERLERFGQGGHIRNFGRDDIMKTLGMIFDIKGYDLRNYFSEKELENANIAKNHWGISPATVFFLTRKDAPLFRRLIPDLKAESAQIDSKSAATVETSKGRESRIRKLFPRLFQPLEIFASVRAAPMRATMRTRRSCERVSRLSTAERVATDVGTISNSPLEATALT